MSSGHTNKATINQQSLTENMKRFLRSVQYRDSAASIHGWQSHLHDRDLSQREKNAARALIDRGMVEWFDRGGGFYRLTDAGRAAIE